MPCCASKLIPQRDCLLRNKSPLFLSALVWAGSLFLAWERGFFLWGLWLAFLLFRRKYGLVSLSILAFFYGYLSFPPPSLDTWRKQITGLARVEKALVAQEFFQKGIATVFEPAGHEKRALFYFPEDTRLVHGDIFETRMTLKNPRSFWNPFAPDFARQRAAYGIEAVGRASTPRVIRQERGYLIEKIRSRLFSFAEGLSPAARGLFEALILGEKSHLPAPLRHSFENLGLFHFLAVSGLHFGLLLGICYLFLKALFFFWPRPLLILTDRQWLFLCATPLLFCYALITGPSPSALRALVMYLVFGLALLGLRPLKGLDLWALAVWVILLFQPQAVGNFSFRLSVCAVLALILANQGRKLLPWPEKKIWRYPLASLYFSLVATLATAPWLLVLKGSFSPWAPVSNLLATPVFAFLVLPLCLLATFLSFGEPSVAVKLAELAPRALPLPRLSLPQLTPPLPVGIFVLLLALGGGVILWARGKSRILGLVLVFLLAFWAYQAYRSLNLFLLLDVGEGSAGLVKISGYRKAILFDTGPRVGRFDAGEFIIAPTLRKLGLTPHLAVISHLESDHVGGLKSLKEIWPNLEEISPSRRPEEYRGPGFALTFYSACRFSNQNENSLVTKLSLAGLKILFPGDIGRKRERELVAQDISADLLVLPHHGARNSATYPFLKKVSPTLVFSSSRRAGHPARETLTRLKSLGLPHLGTKNFGAISLIWSDPKEIYLCTEKARRKYPLLWRSLWPLVKVGCRPLALRP